MTSDVIITREIPPLPRRADDAHKGNVGRIVVIGGCSGEVTMIGAPALVANAALRSGAGLVQLFIPESTHGAAASLAPCATMRALPQTADRILDWAHAYHADVLAVGPGLDASLLADVLVKILNGFNGPIVVDADGLNLLCEVPRAEFPNAARIVLTPHPGEAHRLLVSRGVDREIGSTPASRRAAACALVEAFGCTVVLKGHRTVVTNGRRLYVNETGNSGMASAGTGDVLTGVIAALIGQRLDPLDASILGVYLHGLAGDFAAEELGRRSLTALDVIDYLPDAFCDHENSEGE